jgi:hypothetical protein
MKHNPPREIEGEEGRGGEKVEGEEGMGGGGRGTSVRICN